MAAKFSDLEAFISVARHLSFQRAAVDRGVTRSAISHAVRGLETSLGVRLLNRNTRNVTLTEPGQVLLARLVPAFAAVSQAIDEVNGFRDTPQGTLKVTAPRAVGLTLMGPVIAALTRDNPGLSIDVSSDDSLVDIIADGFDAGIRFGERLQPDMVAVRIDFPLHFAVVGSPDYFRDRPVPQVPAELMDHRCIRYRFPSGVVFPWEFRKGDEALQVAVRGPIQLDDQELMIETALAGAGLAFVFAERIRPHLESGRLVRCLADWTPEFGKLYLYYPERRFVTAGLRALIDRVRRPLDSRDMR